MALHGGGKGGLQCLRHWLLSLVPASARYTAMGSKWPSALTTFRYVVSCASVQVIDPTGVGSTPVKRQSIDRR